MNNKILLCTETLILDIEISLTSVYTIMHLPFIFIHKVRNGTPVIVF